MVCSWSGRRVSNIKGAWLDSELTITPTSAKGDAGKTDPGGGCGSTFNVQRSTPITRHLLQHSIKRNGIPDRGMYLHGRVTWHARHLPPILERPGPPGPSAHVQEGALLLLDLHSTAICHSSPNIGVSTVCCMPRGRQGDWSVAVFFFFF